MPFTTDTLPEEVQSLPKEAQQIWLSVFNSTFRTFAGSDSEKEEASFIVAWSAVRSKFQQDEAGSWHMKSSISFEDPHGLHGRWTRSIKFTSELMEAKKRITYGEVYAPWTVDAQGDFSDEGTIEDAAHNFLKHFGTIGEQHRLFGGKGVPVESFISRAGDRDFKMPGTWVLGTQWSEEMWQKVMNGEVTGYSLGGDWTRMPLVAGREFAKRITSVKSASVPLEIAELDEQLFEHTVNAGPRVINQIVKLNVDEVSGVSLPANREPFKLFKGVAMKRIPVVGKGGKCDCEDKDKAGAASPWLKLYQNFLDAGVSEEDARRMTEDALGPPPPGTLPDKAADEGETEPAKAGEMLSFADVVAKVEELVGPGNGVPVASLLQAKYAAGADGGVALPPEMTLEDAIAWAIEQGTAAGIFAMKAKPEGEQVTLLKHVVNAIKSIAAKLGVKDVEEPKEDEAMTAQEKKDFDELKALVVDLGAKFAKQFPQTTDGGEKPNAAETKTQTATAEAVAETPTPAGGDGAYQPTAGEVELHGRVKELEATIAALRQRPGTSDVAQVTMAPEAVAAEKSMGGSDYRYSSIIGTAIPVSAGNAEVQANIARMKSKQARRDAYGRHIARRGQ